MRSRKSSQPSNSTTDSIADTATSYSPNDYDDQDTMCLVYPDGRITTVMAQASPA